MPRLDALAGYLEKALENQTKVMGNLEEMRNNQSELYTQIREATARAEEANRTGARSRPERARIPAREPGTSEGAKGSSKGCERDG